MVFNGGAHCCYSIHLCYRVRARLPGRRSFWNGIKTKKGVGAAWNTANVKFGSSAAIFGLGAVGLAVAAGAKARGATRIIGVDINKEKFAKGKAMGITKFIDPNDVKRPVHEIYASWMGRCYLFRCGLEFILE